MCIISFFPTMTGIASFQFYSIQKGRWAVKLYSLIKHCSKSIQTYAWLELCSLVFWHVFSLWLIPSSLSFFFFFCEWAEVSDETVWERTRLRKNWKTAIFSETREKVCWKEVREGGGREGRHQKEEEERERHGVGLGSVHCQLRHWTYTTVAGSIPLSGYLLGFLPDILQLHNDRTFEKLYKKLFGFSCV